MSKVLAQWEKRKTAIQKSKVRFAVLTALMKMVSKPKAKGKKKDTKAIAEIISKYMYKAFPTKAARGVIEKFETFIGTVFSVNNDILYSFGSSRFVVICEISENGYKRFFDTIKTKKYKSINETIAFQKQELDSYAEMFNEKMLGLNAISSWDDLLNNFDSYDKSKCNVKTIDVNKAINFIDSNKNITLSTFLDFASFIDNLYFVNVLKIYSSFGIEKVSMKYPIISSNYQAITLNGIDVNGYIMTCLMMPKEKGALKGYRNDNKDWIEVKDVLFFDGQWSVVPRSKFED